MAGSAVMELTERNLAKHDERLAEIREKRMIDPNSEKFYRIWSWIRDVNEQLASGGNLTTPSPSRPSTGRQSQQGAVGVGANIGSAHHYQPHDNDIEEVVIVAPSSSHRQNGGNGVPLALLNVATTSHRNATEADVTYIDDEDVRAVDDDDYEPPVPRNSGVSQNKQHTWATLAGATTSTRQQGMTPRQHAAQLHLKLTQQQQLSTNGRANVTPTATAAPMSAFQNYPYGPTPSGKVIFARNGNNENSIPAPNMSKEPNSLGGVMKKAGEVNINSNVMPAGAYYTSTNRSGHGNQVSTAPAIGSRNHTMPATTTSTPGTTTGERLRSAVSRRTAPAVISVSANQTLLQPSHGFLNLKVNGEQLKPKAAIESRSQASLVSTDPSNGTSKFSLPLMDRIRRIASKVKPLKSAFGSNSVAPSSRNMSMDSLTNGEGFNSGSMNDLNNMAPNTLDYRASPRVRFIGVPPLDDEDDIDDVDNFNRTKQNTYKNQSSTATQQQYNNNKATPGQAAKRVIQQTAQRFYRPFVTRAPQGRSQDSSAPIQVTLV